jgi:hypothetical protein
MQALAIRHTFYQPRRVEYGFMRKSICSVLLVKPYYESTHKRSAEEEA